MIAERDPPGSGEIEALNRLFEGGPPSAKIAAALALASSQSACAEYAYERLLEAPPEEISPIVRALSGRMHKLRSRLEKDAGTLSSPLASLSETDDIEAHDRRRASAAAALVLLGQHDSGFRLLEFAPDPQARAFLIHTLLPAHVSPGILHEKLVNPNTDPSVRRALILALGEMPSTAPNLVELAHHLDRAGAVPQ